MWKCPECQTANPDYARFCTNCGRLRSEGGGEQSGGTGGKTSGGTGGKTSGGSNLWLWLVLALLVLASAALVLILVLNRDKTPDKSSDPVHTAAPAGEQPTVPTPVSEQGNTPTTAPTAAPTTVPTAAPTAVPTAAPTAVPTTAPVQVPITSPPAAFVGYLDDASRLESKGLDQLCRVMEDTIAYNVRTSWGAPEHLDRSYYVGLYLLSAKTDSTWPRNILVLVYRNEVTISIPAENVNKSLSYYYTLRFENVWCNEDGSLNLPTPQKPEQRVEANIPGHYFYYMGYQTTDDVFLYLLAPYTDEYELTQRYTG